MDDDLLLHTLSPVQPLHPQQPPSQPNLLATTAAAAAASGAAAPPTGTTGSATSAATPSAPGTLSATSSGGFCISLRDACGSRLTLVYPGGRMYRCAMPPMAECPFVRRLLAAMRSVLPLATAMLLFVRWYGARNAPGTQDLNALQEWRMFADVLMEMVGRPPAAKEPGDPADEVAASSSGSEGPTVPAAVNHRLSYSDAEPKKRRKSDSCEGTDADWVFLLGYVERSNAERGPRSTSGRQPTRRPPVNPRCSPPFARYNTTAPLFNKLPLVFYTLHLFYEDQKLGASEAPLHRRSLGELLYQLALDMQLDAYQLHYFCDRPAYIQVQSASILTEVETKLMSHQMLLAGPVPSINCYLHSIVSDEAAGRPKYPWLRGCNDRSRRLVALTNLIQSGVCTATTAPAADTVYEPVRWGKQAASATALLPDPDEQMLAEFGDSTLSLRQRVVRALLRMRLLRADIAQLPLALQILVVDFLEECRRDGRIDRADPAVCRLLLRPDWLAHAEFERREAERAERPTSAERGRIGQGGAQVSFGMRCECF